MKLKYYLRGLGMGIIFATLVLTVSSVIHNNNLSDEKIIAEAKKLGMVMPEETETSQGGLWGNNGKAESTETESMQQETESLTEPTETEGDSETTTEVAEQSSEDDKKNEGRPVTGENGRNYVIINVYPGDTARMIAERLYTNDLVDDAEAFRKYLGQTGRANTLYVGEFMIPVGATYEEVFNALLVE